MNKLQYLSTDMTQNPLKQFFRQYKTFIRLPSGTNHYPQSVVELNSHGDLGIMSMTGQDEMILKNPDALLNGQALIDVILSCAPGVKQPSQLIANDVDAIITAIRYATYNDSLETSINCPKCGSENSFKLDLGYALDSMTFLEPSYEINLINGLTLHVRPYRFPEIVKGLHSQFDQARLVRAVNDSNMTEEQRTAALGSALKAMSKTTFDLTCSAVYRITNQEGTLDVSDAGYIEDYLKNVESDIIDKVSNLIEKISAIGVNRKFSVTCQNCEHEWSAEIDLNPVNFS